MPTTTFYKIHCHTHLHVGSGDSNYGVIDKLVQRDPSDEMPCIFASSLKGAMREYFCDVVFADKVEKKDRENAVIKTGVFETGEKGGEKGTHIFHDALLVSIPVRSNAKAYYNAVSPMALQKLITFAHLFDVELNRKLAEEIDFLCKLGFAEKNKVVIFEDIQDGQRIEDFDSGHITKKAGALTELSILIGGNIALFHDTDFKQLCDDYSLPIIARNQLENGESKNLWYEQIVPRESTFFYIANCYSATDNLALHTNNKTVQIGANATVGYGQCKISVIPTTKKA